jgi:nucleotide-binding universal stress UspA family protein
VKHVFQKILVALDGSEHSWKALESAIQIAKKFNGKITLIHVYSTVTARPLAIPEPGTLTAPTIPPVATATEISRIIENARKIGTDVLTEGERRVRNKNILVESLLVEGKVSEEIVKAAKERNCDLIVMGARGLSKLKEIILGSASHEVVRKAPCQVLIVK